MKKNNSKDVNINDLSCFQIIKKLWKPEIFGRERDFFATYFYAPLGVLASAPLIKTSVSPMAITNWSLFFAVLSAPLFATGVYKYILLAGLFTQISMILDNVDGTLARAKKMGSKLGAWQDVMSDVIANNFVLTGITFGLFFQTGDYLMWLYGALALFGVNMTTFVYFTRETFLRGLVIAEVGVARRSIGFLKIKPQYLILTGNFQFFLYGLGALFNKLPWVLWILIIFQNFYWIANAAFVYKYAKAKRL